VTVPSSLRRAGESFKDFDSHGELNLTFAGVLAKSSNMGTILAAEKTGFETLYRYMQAFGIGQPTDVGLPESRGLLPAPSDWSATTPYTMAFGQGYSITALQGASIFATIANDGVRVQPTIVKGYRTDDGAVEAASAPATKRVVSSEAAATVRTMLEAVTGEGGTAPAARIPGYRVAGKTGTANRVDPACGCYRGYTLSFSGFAPADAPQIVVSVVLQDPQHGSGGGSEAGPVFKEVMSFALSARKIPPTGSPPPDVRITTD
jgi:cell division protein FtsI (penicillin-binding protein 3)